MEDCIISFVNATIFFIKKQLSVTAKLTLNSRASNVACFAYNAFSQFIRLFIGLQNKPKHSKQRIAVITETITKQLKLVYLVDFVMFFENTVKSIHRIREPCNMFNDAGVVVKL